MRSPVLLLPLLLALLACSPGEQEAKRGARAPAVPLGPPPPIPSAADTAGGTGGLVYVPVYSHIYDRDHKRTFQLAVTLTVRNTDPERAMEVVRVTYYDTGGKPLREYLPRPVTLGPLGTAEYVVERRDDAGGAGANFLVQWRAAARVTDPVIESVMIGSEGGQGISFLSVGRPLVRGGGGARVRP